MKIILCVFSATVAMVASQGYNYQQQLPLQQQQYAPQQYQQQNQFLQAQPVVMQIVPSVQLPVNSFNQAPIASAPVSSPAFVSHPQISNQQAAYRPRPNVRVAKKPIVSKSFFIHSAPEETEEDIQEEMAQLSSQPRKHYNVLFIKSPTQTNRATALNFAQSLNEEKTVVYVLTKKTTAADLQDAARDTPQKTSKPEVFFIKYRTPEEAANAQRQIQAQYDTLGGSSTISDEGLAQVTSVIGSLDPKVEEDVVQNQNFEEVVDNSLASNNGYLPPQY